MRITDIPQDTEPRVGDIIEIEQGDQCFEVRIIGITADGYLCEQDNVQGAVLLEGTALDHTDVNDIMPLVEGLRDPKDNPCWKGYHPVGTKKKNGRTVPNCVPNAKESVEEGSVTKKPQPYNDPNWIKKLSKEKLDALAGPRYKKDKKDEPSVSKKQGVEEAGPFSYGAKKPRRGSVADLAAKKRREQEKNRPPIEPKDQMVGTAKLTKDVSETSDYFRRREREEAIISGQKPARKKQPAQTSDYARRREQEKKAEKGVSESNTSTTAQGSYVVANGSKVKKFKTLQSAKAYAEKNGGKISSEEVYSDKMQKQGVAEGLDPALDQQLTQLARNPDFDAIYDALGRNDALGARLQDMADDIARDYRLHMDDDIERIIDILADRLENDYGQGVAESGLQYHTGVKKHGAEYMRRAAQAGREGASQEEIGRLRDRYSKAYKKDVKEGGEDWGSMSKHEFKRRELEHELGHEVNRPREQPKGMWFYNVPTMDLFKAKAMGLRQSRSGKWYSTSPNARADQAYGPGRYWEPKNKGMGEAKYHGREVPLGKKMAGDVKKSKVYVRKPNGKVVKVNFGDPNMRIRKSDPKRRKSFRARHNCANPGPRWRARYWSCRSW